MELELVLQDHCRGHILVLDGAWHDHFLAAGLLMLPKPSLGSQKVGVLASYVIDHVLIIFLASRPLSTSGLEADAGSSRPTADSLCLEAASADQHCGDRGL